MAFGAKSIKLCQIDTWLLEWDPEFVDLLDRRLNGDAK